MEIDMIYITCRRLANAYSATNTIANNEHFYCKLKLPIHVIGRKTKWRTNLMENFLFRLALQGRRVQCSLEKSGDWQVQDTSWTPVHIRGLHLLGVKRWSFNRGHMDLLDRSIVPLLKEHHFIQSKYGLSPTKPSVSTLSNAIIIDYKVVSWIQSM